MMNANDRDSSLIQFASMNLHLLARRTFRVLTISVPVVLLLGIAGFATLPWWVGFRFIESKPAYHLRMITWHAKETKDGVQLREHTDELVACGEEAVPLLIAKIRGYKWRKYRGLQPFALMKRIGPAAAPLLIEEIESLQAKPVETAEYSVEEERLAMILALIAATNDWSWFDQWLSDLTHPSVRMRSDIFAVTNLMDLLLRDQLAGDAPPLLDDSIDRELINPKFVDWWRLNREAMLEDQRSQQREI